jgi:hypothetical protein
LRRSAVAAGLFAGVCGYARRSGHWRIDLPARANFDLIPRANEFGHP